jgi:hypothetical protein
MQIDENTAMLGAFLILVFAQSVAGKQNVKTYIVALSSINIYVV